MDNIEFFNRTTAALFKLLHEKFPKPILLNTEAFRETAELPPNPSEDDSEDIDAIVEWLAAEGFIRFGSKAGSGQMFINVVLTSKGLSALDRVPDALTPKVTVGERLKELSRTASTEFVTALVKVALGTAVGS